MELGISHQPVLSKKHAQDGRGVKRPPDELWSLSPLMVACGRALCAATKLDIDG